ncbi:glycosyltransferase [Mesobacillus maritimus]|uniref:glycosyltransferase n=1 Tax=Mesobacillus maritimus TaxID=1643336 RepID=UPI00384AD280
MDINENKIAFIYCSDNEQLLNKSISHISSLNIPVNYEIEIIPIRNATSMCAGYNKGMEKTNAKYKVYLHQDVFISNKNFIYDFLAIFKNNEQIGLLGVAGCEVLPTSGIWMDAHNKFGKFHDSHTGKMQLISFHEFDNDYKIVQAIEGFMMITQYDIPWREDLFDDWHFYNVSHSVEFLRKGYSVVVPKQEEPWCMHDCGYNYLGNQYEYYRNVFLDEYSTFLYPLVSILIPTYNRPDFLKEALESVLGQTYRNIEIIVCDDSTNETTELMIQSYLEKDSNIKYVRNPQKLGGSTGLENCIKCFELSTGEYINFLNDDDLFSSVKISSMMDYFLQFNNIKLVTSFRQLINEQGEILSPRRATEKLFKIDTVVNGSVLGKFVIANLLNVIGEPTTVLFRKSDIEENFGTYFGRQYVPLSDISTWLHLIHNGDAVYIAEPLSFFRWHSGQNTNDIVNMIKATSEWYYLIKDSFTNAVFVYSSDEYKKLLNTWLSYSTRFIHNVNKLALDHAFEKDNRSIIAELNNCHHECLTILKR